MALYPSLKTCFGHSLWFWRQRLLQCTLVHKWRSFPLWLLRNKLLLRLQFSLQTELLFYFIWFIQPDIVFPVRTLYSSGQYLFQWWFIGAVQVCPENLKICTQKTNCTSAHQHLVLFCINEIGFGKVLIGPISHPSRLVRTTIRNKQNLPIRAGWCRDNNLVLNTSKTMELIYKLTLTHVQTCM